MKIESESIVAAVVLEEQEEEENHQDYDSYLVSDEETNEVQQDDFEESTDSSADSELPNDKAIEPEKKNNQKDQRNQNYLIHLMNQSI
nr:hypothetical protein P5652_22530 [Bacillus subtilis]